MRNLRMRRVQRSSVDPIRERTYAVDVRRAQSPPRCLGWQTGCPARRQSEERRRADAERSRRAARALVSTAAEERSGTIQRAATATAEYVGNTGLRFGATAQAVALTNGIGADQSGGDDAVAA